MDSSTRSASPSTSAIPNDTTGPIEGIVLPNANNIQRFVKAGPGRGDDRDAGRVRRRHVRSARRHHRLVQLVRPRCNELLQLGSGDSGSASGDESHDSKRRDQPSTPALASFGMYSNSPTFPGRIVYSENALNTWDGGIQKHVVFPLKDITGTVVPNAYIVGIEEATNNDFQDYVYIIRNVAPYVPTTPRRLQRRPYRRHWPTTCCGERISASRSPCKTKTRRSARSRKRTTTRGERTLERPPRAPVPHNC